MARQGKNTKTGKDISIQLSRRALFYFFGYHFWAAFKKYVLWMLIITVAVTAIGLIRSAQIFGMPDSEIATAFLAPLPRVAVGFLVVIMVYALIRAVISTFSTKYAFTPKGVVIQAGWPTRRTTIVDYAHIQKMTIVSNPFDRMLNATYVQLDLIGGAPGVLLEAVDAQAVKDVQEKLSIPNNALLAAVTPPLTLDLPVKKVKRAKHKRSSSARVNKPKTSKAPPTRSASTKAKTKSPSKKATTKSPAQSSFKSRSSSTRHQKAHTSSSKATAKQAGT